MEGHELQIAALVINVILVLVIFPLRKSIDKLQQSDEKLGERLQSLEIEVARNYVPRSELASCLDDISKSLDRIEARLMASVERLDLEKQDKA